MAVAFMGIGLDARWNEPDYKPCNTFHLRENGADLQNVQEALEHAVITTTTMYAHFTTRRREQLAEYLK